MRSLNRKTSKIVLASVLSLVVVVGAFQNCGKNNKSFTTSQEASELSSAEAGENLLDLLDEAKTMEAKLLAQGEPTAIAEAEYLRKYIDSIEELIGPKGGLAVDNKRVLDERDYLLNGLRRGADVLITLDFNKQIDDLKDEDKRLDTRITDLDTKLSLALGEMETRLKAKIEADIGALNTTILAEIAKMKGDYQSSFDAFKTEVSKSLAQVDARMTALESRITMIENNITAINNMITLIQEQADKDRATTESALQSLKESFEDLKEGTQSQIASLMTLTNQLSKQIVEQQSAFNAYVDAQTTLSSIEARMCKLDPSTGEPKSSENVCATPEDAISGTCCLTANNVNCSLMFPQETDVGEAARNQCSSALVVAKNHQILMKEIADNEEEQNQQIAQLLKDVQNLNDKTAVIAAGLDKLQDAVDEVRGGLEDMDARVLILEFKASRTEAVASLHERSDLALAWIARRRMDVTARFCHSNAGTAYDRSDYESARHNWVYCHERLAWLSQAQELIQLAKAYAEGAASLNVEQNCSATINGKNAEALSPSDLLETNIADQVIKKCSSGQSLARTFLLNIIKLQNKVGPDFRTAEYMAKKAKIAQILYFGSLVSVAGKVKIQAFENIDPTSDELKNTYYGKIERVFKNRYIETRLRTSGKFPEDASKFSGTVAGFNLVYSEKEIKTAATAYLKRVKSQEIEGSCGNECGFKVTARNVTARIGNRYSYPKDAETKCPVIDDMVMVKSADGKHYAYKLNYTRYQGATEELLPYYSYSGNHHPIAKDDAAASRGEFLGCGYRVSHIVSRFGIPDALLRGRHVLRYGKPYAKSHGLPQCQHFVFNCHLWSGTDGQGEWVAPASENTKVLHYLSGLSTDAVQKQCSISGSNLTASSRKLLKEETDKMYYYKNTIDAGTVNMRNATTSKSTQLTSDYWMLRDASIAYGSGNVSVAKDKPFYAGKNSTSENFMRSISSITSMPGTENVQQCFSK